MYVPLKYDMNLFKISHKLQFVRTAFTRYKRALLKNNGFMYNIHTLTQTYVYKI